MNTRHSFSLFIRALRWVLAVLAAGALLSGCAAASAQNSGACVGPPDYCIPYFG